EPGLSWAALLVRDLLPDTAIGALFRPIPYLIVIGVSAAFAVLAVGRTLLQPDLDVLGLFLLASLGSLSAACLFGGFLRRGHWSLRAGIKAALAGFLFQLPAVLSLLCVFL